MPIAVTNYPLPANLPEDWQPNQIVAPDGTAVGLDEQHGYNYLMKQVNDSQEAINSLVVTANSVTADSAELTTGSIAITTPYQMQQGVSVKFEAPCNSEDVSVGIVVDGIQYQWMDTLGEGLANVAGLFVTGTMVCIILDRDNLIAYLVNASPSKGFVQYESGNTPTVMLQGTLYGEILVDYNSEATDVSN